MSIAELRETLSAAHQKHLDPAAPLPARMMAAKGVLPLPPREMLVVLCGLTSDAMSDVAEAARASLGKVPDKLIAGALESGLPPAALTVLAPLLVGRDELVEQLVLRKETPDEAFIAIAPTAPERIVEIVAANQERCLRSAALVHAIRLNPHLLHSSRDRLFDFLVRAGVIYDDIPEFADAMARLSPTEIAEAAERVALPPEAAALIQVSADDDEKAQVAAAALESPNGEAKERVPMLKLIASLGVSQRVALAVKGNKEARSILLRDMNRVVASAAIRNPRLTEQEVIAAAQSRQICDEVITVLKPNWAQGWSHLGHALAQR